MSNKRSDTKKITSIQFPTDLLTDLDAYVVAEQLRVGIQLSRSEVIRSLITRHLQTAGAIHEYQDPADYQPPHDFGQGHADRGKAQGDKRPRAGK